MKFIGDGEYNVNVMKEVEVTESYLGLDQKVRGCQKEESFHNCTTNHYFDSLLEKCACLPFKIRLSDKVFKTFYSFLNQYCIYHIDI